jgi:hypothetical protein
MQVGVPRHMVEHPEGERYDRAVLRVGLAQPAADPVAFGRDVAARVKAAALIGVEVELVGESELPEGAAPPRFADVMLERAEAARGDATAAGRPMNGRPAGAGGTKLTE